MNANKSKKSAWPAICTVKRADGQGSFQIAVMIHGKRIRERFKTQAAAEERAAQIRFQYQEEGNDITSPPLLAPMRSPWKSNFLSVQ